MTAHVPNWIELEGVVNVRDVGGLPAADGRRIRPGVLIRSANLNSITEADVARLVDELGVRRVLDLRTDVELRDSEPGLLHGRDGISFHHLSLYPDAKPETPDPVVPGPASGSRRPGSAGGQLPALPGAPAGLDRGGPACDRRAGRCHRGALRGRQGPHRHGHRAGTVGGRAWPRELIAADYAESQSQILAIIKQLSASDLYDLDVAQPEKVPPAAAGTMLGVLAAIDADHGGVLPWLAEHGWTAEDTERLRAKLLD